MKSCRQQITRIALQISISRYMYLEKAKNKLYNGSIVYKKRMDIPTSTS